MTNPKDTFVTKQTFLKKALSFKNILFVTSLIFAVLSVLAKQTDYFKSDLSISIIVQRFNPFWFDGLMKLITFLGNVPSVVVLVLLLGLYGYTIGKRHAPLVLMVSSFGGLILSFIAKVLVLRPRPDPLLINQIGQFVYLDSFPSGHVMGAVSLYGFLLYIAYTQLKKGILRSLVIVFCILVIILMGLSRIYVGAHWFSDVLGAYLLGFIWLTIMVHLYQMLKPNIRPSD